MQTSSRISPTAFLRCGDGGATLSVLSVACGFCPDCHRGSPDRCRAPMGEPLLVGRWHRAVGRWAASWSSVLPADPQRAVEVTASLVRAAECMRVAGIPGAAVAVVGTGAAPEAVVEVLAPGAAVIRSDVGAVAAGGRTTALADALERWSRDWPASGVDVVVSLDGDLDLAARVVRRRGLLAAVAPVVVPATGLLQEKGIRVLEARDTAATAARLLTHDARRRSRTSARPA